MNVTVEREQPAPPPVKVVLTLSLNEAKILRNLVGAMSGGASDSWAVSPIRLATIEGPDSSYRLAQFSPRRIREVIDGLFTVLEPVQVAK